MMMRNNTGYVPDGEKAKITAVGADLLKHSKNIIAPTVFALLLAVAGTVLVVLGPNQLAKLASFLDYGLYGEIDFGAMAEVGVLLICMFVFGALCTYFQHYIMSTTTLKFANGLRQDMTAKINKVPLEYYNTSVSGDMLSRMTNDVQTLSQALSNSLPGIVTSAVQFLGCLIMMFVTEWRMSLAAIAATVIGFALMIIIMKKSQKYFVAQQSTLGSLNGYIEEMYSGHDVVRISNAGNSTKGIFSGMNKKVYAANSKAQFYSGIMQPLMTFIGNLGYVAVCVVGAVLAINNEIEFTVIVAFIMYVRLFTSPLSTLAQGMTNMQMAAASGNRIFSFLAENELEDETGKQAAPENVKGEVVFDKVHFSYPDNPDKIIIKDFSAHVKSGEKVAIVGPTGAGKTTMVNLLMRFFEINSGSISVDGVPIADMRREAVHDMFAMVLQDTWLFEGTVRENLVYNKQDVPDSDLEKACRACGIYGFIETLPKKFDTVLGDGYSLSAGQKQLFTIARAMIQNAPMLILDEATSSVDTRTELITQRAMDKLTENRTSFVIAHRLSTIKNSDLILVMKDGDIVEQGDHEKLLKKKGFYADLYNSQFAKPVSEQQ